MKRIVSIGLIVCLLAIQGIGVLSFANAHLKPLVGLVASETIQELKAGEKGTYEIQVKNASNTVAQWVKISIDGAHPFRSDVGNLNKRISFLNPNKVEKVTFDVIVSPLAENKIYEFDIVFEYQNYDEESFTERQKAYVRVINNKVEPIIAISGTRNQNQVVEFGQTSSLVVNLQNTGTVAAKDMRVKLSGFSNEGIVLNREADTKVISEIRANSSQMVYFNVQAGKDMVTSTSAINVSLSYKDEFGKSYEQTGILYVSLKGKADQKVDKESSIKINALSAPSRVNINEDFEVVFEVVNTSEKNAVNAEVNLDYSQEFIAKSGAKNFIRNLAPGESKEIRVKLMAKSDTKTETYHNYVNVKYSAANVPDAVELNLQDYVGIFVQGKAEETDKEKDTSRPKLIIDNYEYGGEVVYAGEDYVLELFIKNTSLTEGTRNIKVTLTSDDNVFTPVDSSSSFFIKSIGPNEVHRHSVSLKTKIDASVKIYAVTVKMEYEDSKGNAYDSKNNPFAETEALSVAVAQPVRLETADMVIPFEIYSGQPFYLEQEFYNMGKSTMYNMMVRLEGEGIQTNDASYFVGNFDAGRSEFYSAQIFAGEPGTFEGMLVYTFEDALGTISRVEKPFTYTVMEMFIPDFGDGSGEDPWGEGEIETEKALPWKWILPIGAVVLAAGGFIFLRVRKKKKIARELEALDE